MYKNKRVAALAALGTLTALAISTPASAEDAAERRLAAVVDKATSAELSASDVGATKARDGAFATTGKVSVEIPALANGKVVAKTVTANGHVTVEVGTGSSRTTAGALAPDGSVAYDDPEAIDHTVQPTSDGVRIYSVIAAADAPTAIEHSVTLPAGARLVSARDLPDKSVKGSDKAFNGAVFILSADNALLGGFSAPWAKDANGVNVPTRYEIRSGALVQIVDHRGPHVKHPVVADPYLGFDMIHSARWVWHSEGFTMEVTPTGWSRANAGGYVPGVYGWRELYDKYKDRGLNTNLDGMRDQYICHQQIVAVRAPRKATWNLDEWRPNVSYASTVNASCNPGGSKWFD